MRSTQFKLIPLLLVALFLPACRGIDPGAIKGPAANIGTRHDAYIDKDTKVDAVEKTFFKSQVQAVNAKIGEASANKKLVDPRDIDTAVDAINKRHDTYVKKDASLTDLEKDIYLRETKLFGTIVDEALKPFK